MLMTYKKMIALSVVFVSSIGASLASSLCAANVVSFKTEFILYYLSFISIAIAGCVLAGSSEHALRICAGWIMTILLLVGVCVADIYSNETFLFWKLRMVKKLEWVQMATALATLDRSENVTHSTRLLRSEEIESSFKQLGVLSDFSGGKIGVESDHIVAFGGKSRRWGMIIGTSRFSSGKWSSFDRVNVSDDVWLFVGEDD
jgi:hypothetical protein